nr:hypothetical protein [Saprospiraceae bacterium]
MERLLRPFYLIRLLPKLLFFVLFISGLVEIKAQSCEAIQSGGHIAMDQTGCASPSFDPSIISNITLPTVTENVQLEYLWLYTEGDPSLAIDTWTPILNSNSINFDPAPIQVTTHFIRCVRVVGCDEFLIESNYVTVTIDCNANCSDVTFGGRIGSDQTGCANPTFDPAPFLSVTPPSGGTGTLTYQWQKTSADPSNSNTIWE